MKSIIAKFKNIVANMQQSDIERYLSSKSIKTEADLEYYLKKYQYQKF
jgi:hypothetical protein